MFPNRLPPWLTSARSSKESRVQQRPRPAGHDAKEDVIEDVPRAERKRRVPGPTAPRASREHPDRGEHDQRRRLAPQFDVAQRVVDRQRVWLVRLDPIDERADVEHACGFDPGHRNRESHHDHPARSLREVTRHRNTSTSLRQALAALAAMAGKHSQLLASAPRPGGLGPPTCPSWLARSRKRRRKGGLALRRGR